MKKHYFGIALFCLIVGTTAALVDLFRPAPIMNIEEPLRCPHSRFEIPEPDHDLNPANKRAINYAIDSATYFEAENKLVVKMRFEWKGAGRAPEKVVVEPRIFSSLDFANTVSLASSTVYFSGDSRVSSVTIESTGVLSGKARAENFYVGAVIRNANDNSLLTPPQPEVSRARQVLYSYSSGRVTPVRD